MSRHILSSGIFSAEPGQRLLSICDTLARRAFSGLYTKCKDNVNGSYYQTGLKRVHVWSDDIVKEDIEFVRSTCPDIDETYEMCFVHYVEERFRGNRRPLVNSPPLLKFVRRFLESVALHEHLQTAEFFTTRDIVQRRITCMDACRQAFYSIVNADSVRVETESIVSRGAPPSEVSIVKQETVSHDVVLESEEPDISPSDSISNINVPRSVVSRGVEDDAVPQRDSESVAEEEREYKEESRADRDPSPAPRRVPPRDEYRNSTPRADVRPRQTYPTQEDHRGASATPHPPSSYISTASSTSRRRADDSRQQRKVADESVGHHYHPELMEETRSNVSRHDFDVMENASVAPLRTRSAVGSRDSSVSIGMKRMKSPRAR